MDIGRLVLAILFFGTMVGIYILLFLLNKRTPKPPGTENLRADCDACKDYSCINNPSHHQQGEKQ